MSDFTKVGFPSAVGGYDPWARMLTSEDMDAIQLSIKSHAKAAGLDMVTVNNELDKISKKDTPLLGQSNLPRFEIDTNKPCDTGWQDIANSLGSEDKAWVLLKEAVARETTKTQADLEKLCRADSVSEGRWFPTSATDGEWLIVITSVDTLSGRDSWDGDIKIELTSGIVFYINTLNADNDLLAVHLAVLKDIYTKYKNAIELSFEGHPNFNNDFIAHNECGHNALHFLAPIEHLKDFIATNGGEATGPPVINGFVAPFVVLVDDWEGSEVGRFDIEIKEAV